MGSLTCTVTYVDGLPGLGKTTAVAALAARSPDLIMVCENNPLPEQERELATLDPVAVSRWYMSAEQRRAQYVYRLAGSDGTRSPELRGIHVLCDKSGLAVLAYAFACVCVGFMNIGDYAQLRDQYLTDVRPHLSPFSRTVLFSGPVSLGLDRRRDKPDRAIRPLWFDPAFLDAQELFFRDHVADLVDHPVQRIDAGDSPGVLIDALARLIGVGPESRPAPGGEGAGQSAALLEQAAATIGEAVLGRPIGRPFRQLGYTAQAHERHLLVVPGQAWPADGSAGVQLQAREWHPSRRARRATGPTHPLEGTTL